MSDDVEMIPRRSKKRRLDSSDDGGCTRCAMLLAERNAMLSRHALETADIDNTKCLLLHLFRVIKDATSKEHMIQAIVEAHVGIFGEEPS